MPNRLLLAVAACLTAAALPATAVAGPSVPGAGKLSDRLYELTKLQGASHARQARKVSLPVSGPASLSRTPDGELVVEVEVSGIPAVRADGLRKAGARILHVSTRSHIVSAAARAGDLRAISKAPGVIGVHEVYAPEYNATCPSGDIVSEGDDLMNSVNARTQRNVSGQGVKVGVISDSWDNTTTDTKSAADDTASGDIPGPTSPCPNKSTPDVVDAAGTGEDEGRAMGQIVHDIAPDAQLLFRQGGPTESAFADHIRDLATAGAKVIVDDVTFIAEPMFQDGVISNAVTEVAGKGVSYFSSAANANVIGSGGKNVASYETPAFRPTNCPSSIVTAESGTNTTVQCHDFDNQAHTLAPISIPPGSTARVNLQWAQPQKGVTTDLDVFLVESNGTIDASSATNNIDAANQKPLEVLTATNNGAASATVYVVVARYSGSPADSGTPRFKYILGGIEDSVSAVVSGDVSGPTIFGHNGAALGQSVAAMDVRDPSKPDDYSSRGPLTLVYGPVKDDGTAAAKLATPQVLAKPDVTAPDCNRTTFFTPAADGFRFCGTSSAAPHAAGVAALMLQKKPSASPDQILGAQQDTASDVSGFGPEAVGAGLVDALAAVTAMGGGGGGAVPPAPSPSPSPAPVTSPPPVITPPADTTPPAVKVSSKPKKRTTCRKATIKFNQGDAVQVTCKLDKARAKVCKSPLKLKKLKRGKHTLVITATDGAGNQTVRKVKWKVVKPKRK